MREELGGQVAIENVHMGRSITKVREKRKMRTNLTHFPIDDEIGATRGHHDIIEQPRHYREPGYSKNKER